jgi:hypothetical protein
VGKEIPKKGNMLGGYKVCMAKKWYTLGGYIESM